MYCTKCGSKVEEGTLFCTECGAKLDMEETSAPSIEESKPEIIEVEKQTVATPENNKKKMVVIGGIVAGLVLVAGIALAVVFLSDGGSTGGEDVETETSTDSEASGDTEVTDASGDESQMQSEVEIVMDRPVVSSRQTDFYSPGGGVDGHELYKYDERGRVIYYEWERRYESYDYQITWVDDGLNSVGTYELLNKDIDEYTGESSADIRIATGEYIEEEYDTAGNVLVSRYYNANGGLKTDTVNTYENGIISKSVMTDTRYSNQTTVETKLYNEHGDLVDHKIEVDGALQYSRTYTYEYNANGTINSCVEEYHTYVYGEYIYSTEYDIVYDTNGNIVKVTECPLNMTDEYGYDVYIYTYHGYESTIENETVGYDVEAEVEQIREWYYGTQESLDDLLYAGYPDNVDAYFDGAYAAKVAVPSGYKGDSWAKDYYFHDRKMYFVFANDNGNEYRFYFKDDVLIRYIDPNGNIYNYGDSKLNDIKSKADYLLQEAYELESGMVNCGN